MLTLIVSTARTQYRPATAESFKQEFLNYINTTRARGCNCGTKWFPPAPPLSWNTSLQKSAFRHAKDMNDKSYFSHTSKDGRSMQDRIVFAGYIFNGYKSFIIGENIAEGQQSIRQVMQEWFASEGHCHNLMNPAFREIGIAQYNDYWVQDFGGRESYSPAEQRALESGQARVSTLDKGKN
ncbi:CAP domain-containing protein [Mucilaginibacter boryungensis]|uniref:CAP domain-containing protein n=1 Tax=Mucilaginibacter boryungensis TaxID=768480 RepID=A0ABR9XJH9_9SPHI|nr:CAP domain-containing protein [Mucilaginibacter boryungensis]MBE9667553.1 CAP domain-containing protein [Mucilaginibacter boryungensis]